MDKLIELLKLLADAIARFLKNKEIKTTLEAKVKDNHEKVDHDLAGKSDADIVDEIARGRGTK